MKVAGLKNDDWTFGRAYYLTDSEAIAQNVKTRLRSFTDDWFLDVNHGIPWIELLGNRNTERRILRAVERTVLQTTGVVSMSRLQITRRQGRNVTIEFSYTDVYSRTFNEEFTV